MSDGSETELDDSRQDLAPVVKAARDGIDEQFRISERLDQKARGTFSAALLLFGVAQTVTLAAADGATPFSKVVLGVAAALGFLLLVAVAIYTRGVWNLRSDSDIDPAAFDDFVEWSNGQEVRVDLQLLYHYRDVLRSRQDQNEERADDFAAANRLYLILAVVVCFQFAAAVVTRLLTA